MPGKRQVYPHLYDRMIAAGVTPDYARPKPTPPETSWPPSRRSCFFLAVVCWGIGGHPAATAPQDPVNAYWLAVTATHAWERGEFETAARLYGDAAKLDPSQPLYFPGEPGHHAPSPSRPPLDDAEAAVETAEAAIEAGGEPHPAAKALVGQVRTNLEVSRKRGAPPQTPPSKGGAFLGP